MIDPTNQSHPIVISSKVILRESYRSDDKFHQTSAEYRLFYRALLQKRPMVSRSLLIVATPCAAPACTCVGLCKYVYVNMCMYVYTRTHTHNPRQCSTHTASAMHLSVYWYVIMCMYVYASTHTHTHIHTHTAGVLCTCVSV